MKSLLLVTLFFLGMASQCCAQPEKIWGTYYGYWRASHGTRVTATAFDERSGYLYVAGTTYDSTGVATPGSFRSQIHPVFQLGVWQTDIFLAKFDTMGNRIWATYYGADSTQDYNPNIKIDGDGNIYLSGATTSSSGIATPGSFQPSNGFKITQIFLAKFNSLGQRLWGTYSLNAIQTSVQVIAGPSGLAVDHLNNVYIGYATAEQQGIATAGTHKATISATGLLDAYIMKFNPSGIKLWGTYYGGDVDDEIHSLTIDNDNNVIALGNTRSSTGISTAGADNVTYNGLGDPVAFVAKFTASGQRIWGTYVPGNWSSTAIQVLADDRAGKNDVYVTGFTSSDSDVATTGAHQDFLSSIYWPDLFLVKYNAAGARLWSTYYGGEGYEMETPSHPYNTLAFDNERNLYMVGATQSLQYIEHGCPYITTYKRGFFSKWSPTGHLIWSSYHDTPLYGVTGTGKNKDFYVTGNTPFDSLATPEAHQTTKVQNKLSGYIARFTDEDVCPPLTIPLTLNNGILQTNTGYVTYQWYVNGVLIPGANSSSYVPLDSGYYSVRITQLCDCEYTSDSVLYVPPATDILDQAGSQHTAFKLFPNPAKDQLHIISGYSAGTRYRIADLTGRLILSGTLNKASDIDVSVLENGMYLLYLNPLQALRFVVNR